jgi:hypothetical protein
MGKYLTNEEKAKLYNSLLFRFEKLQEEVRQLKAKNFDISETDQQRINFLESQMRYLYSQTQKLYG